MAETQPTTRREAIVANVKSTLQSCRHDIIFANEALRGSNYSPAGARDPDQIGKAVLYTTFAISRLINALDDVATVLALDQG